MKISILTMISLAVGVIILAMMYLMLKGWDVYENTSSLKDDYFGAADYSFRKISVENFISYINDYYEECGKLNETRLYVSGEGELSKEYIFNVMKNLSWCHRLQSASLGCGIREDIQMNTILMPQAVRIGCTNGILTIS
jgi:hypothetical protein